MATYDAYDPYEGATQFQSNQQNQVPQQPTEADQADKSVNNDQRKAIIAAGVGTAALGGAAYGLSMLEDSENQANGEGDGSGDEDGNGDGSNNLKNSLADGLHNTPVPTPPTPQPPVDPFAGLTGFDKAFHEARLAMGAGHTFQYEGQTYNTYTKEEEAALSPEERNAFLASNNIGPASHGHHHSDVAVASTDPDHFPSVTLDHDAPGGHHNRVASTEPSVSLDDDASVSLDTDHDLHHIHVHDHDTVATLDDHHDSTHDLHDPLHDFDNHADVSDFT